jgi:hypothetical protein
MVVIPLEANLAHLAGDRFAGLTPVSHRSSTLWATRLRFRPLVSLNLLFISHPIIQQRLGHPLRYFQRFRFDFFKAMNSFLLFPVAESLHLSLHFLFQRFLEPASIHFPLPFFDLILLPLCLPKNWNAPSREEQFDYKRTGKFVMTGDAK